MNKNAIALICLLSVLAACAPQVQPVQPACKASPAPGSCNPDQPPFITINPGTVEASPPRYCVTAGDTVVFRVAGNPAIASVGTVPKAIETWLIGSNATDATMFSVQVPEDTEPGNYEYKLMFSNGDCLDPMITVTR